MTIFVQLHATPPVSCGLTLHWKAFDIPAVYCLLTLAPQCSTFTYYCLFGILPRWQEVWLCTWVLIQHCCSSSDHSCKLCMCIPYSGKFSRGPNFHDFMTHDQNAKIRTMKIWTRELFIPYVLYASLARSDVLTSDYGTIALFQTDIQRPTLSHGTYFVLC